MSPATSETSLRAPAAFCASVAGPNETTLAGGVGAAIVLRVDGDDELARRLAAVGFWPGARVERITSAPFGDPILFFVHGYRVALRRSEAERVRVTVEGSR